MSTHYIFYKRQPNGGFSGTTGFCSFNEKCDTPLHLTNVNGTLTITDRINTLKINIINDIVSIPILVDDDITGRIPITLQEVSGREFKESSTEKCYQFSLGKKFKTYLHVDNKEIKRIGGISSFNAFDSSNSTSSSVIDMNISFKTTGDLQLVLSEK